MAAVLAATRKLEWRLLAVVLRGGLPHIGKGGLPRSFPVPLDMQSTGSFWRLVARPVSERISSYPKASPAWIRGAMEAVQAAPRAKRLVC